MILDKFGTEDPTVEKPATPPEPEKPAEPTAVAEAKPKRSVDIFRDRVQTMATRYLADWVGEEKAAEAAGRVSLAIRAAAGAAKNPQDIYDCTPASIANCVAIAALTDLMPGSGPTAQAYLVPRRPRKGEPPQLTYMISHRGLNTLAVRSGHYMSCIALSERDDIGNDPLGNVQIKHRDFDNPPQDIEDLRGVLVHVLDKDTSHVVGQCWCPRTLIEKRRELSDAYKFARQEKNEWARKTDPWHAWPIEMAIKTAMHYTVARGICPTSDTMRIAMDRESRQYETINDSGLQRLRDKLLPAPELATEGDV